MEKMKSGKQKKYRLSCRKACIVDKKSN